MNVQRGSSENQNDGFLQQLQRAEPDEEVPSPLLGQHAMLCVIGTFPPEGTNQY